MKGIDISDYQRGLDVSTLKDRGISFAILKLGYGTTVTDSCFSQFYDAARAAGIPVGAYFYSLAVTEDEAIRDAKRALSIADGRKLPLGIFMDVEDSRQLALSDSRLTAVVKAFCDVIREAGYIPGAYGSNGNLWAKVGASYLGKDVLVWNAAWQRTKPSVPCDVWQYSESTRIDGYNGNVDGDEALSDRFLALICGNAPATSGETETPAESPYFTLTIPALQHGDVGDAVKALQGELIAAGYRCGGKIVNGAERADGIFGNVTRESVATFQRKHNLVDTGTADKLTRAALLGVK